MIFKSIFSCNSKLLSHNLLHAKENPFMCPICLKLFSRKSYLDMHNLTHEGLRPYICEVCKKVFPHKSNLSEHMVSHTDMLVCNVCNKSFASKTVLRKHAIIHTGDNPFKCNICSKSFSCNSKLVSHNVVHTKESLLNVIFALSYSVVKVFLIGIYLYIWDLNLTGVNFVIRVFLKNPVLLHTCLYTLINIDILICNVYNKLFSSKTDKNTIIYRVGTPCKYNIC